MYSGEEKWNRIVGNGVVSVVGKALHSTQQVNRSAIVIALTW